jgi:dTDP-D-glucose 4,6-dehydratase
MRDVIGNWQPPTRLRDGIRQTVQWWMENQWETRSEHSDSMARLSS